MNVFKDLRLPLPVSLVTTVDAEGRPNASPKSWWTPVSYDPPLLQLNLKPTSDTCANVAVTGVWLFHLPPQQMAEKVLHTAKSLPRGECELDDVGLDWEWLEHPKLQHPMPKVLGMPYLLCWVLTAFQQGDHVSVTGQVGLAGGFDAEWGVDAIVLHRGLNAFVALGPEFTVTPY